MTVEPNQKQLVSRELCKIVSLAYVCCKRGRLGTRWPRAEHLRFAAAKQVHPNPTCGITGSADQLRPGSGAPRGVHIHRGKKGIDLKEPFLPDSTSYTVPQALIN